MKTERIVVACILLMLFKLPAQELKELVQEGESLFEKTKSQLVFPKTSEYNPQLHFYTKLEAARSVNFWESELKRIESKQSQQDIGLVFKASALYNFSNVFDNENNNFNIGQIRTELEWNVLKTGYTNNRFESQRLENERQILQNNRLTEDRMVMRRQFRIDYSHSINHETMLLLSHFLQFENEYFDFLNKLYFKKYIQRERLIKVSQQISSLKNQLSVLQKENALLKDSVSEHFLHLQSLPFLKLQIDSLTNSYNSGNLELQKQNVFLEHKAINDLNFSVYVQESVNYSNAGHRFFPSIGVRFRAPIRFNQRKKIVDAKIKILEAQHRDEYVGKQNQIITLLGGYQEKLKDVQNQYKMWKVVDERIRVLSVLKSELKHDETGILLLELVEEKFQILENMLQLKRQLYTSLSHIFEVLEMEDINNITSSIDFTEFDEYKPFAIRSNSVFDLAFQIQFFKSKGGTELQVLEEDRSAQEALRKANLSFYTVKKFTNPEVAHTLQKELYQIQETP